ncbi:MAG: PD40 domain-containing protein [Anaerolineales bacterium]|nr:PD40 domain-containing protein [Anaerolineales bacterium]
MNKSLYSILKIVILSVLLFSGCGMIENDVTSMNLITQVSSTATKPDVVPTQVTTNATAHASKETDTATPKVELHSYYSLLPSGEYIIYMNEQDNRHYAVSLDGEINLPLLIETSYVESSQINYTPFIAVYSSLKDNSNPYLFNFVTEDLVEVPLDESPCGKGIDWSPDGKQVAIICVLESKEYPDVLFSQIYGFDLKTQVYSELIPEPQLYDDIFPPLFWSPDGKWIAYHQRNSGTLGLTEEDGVYIVSTNCIGQEDCTLERLGPIFSKAPMHPLAWSQDGRYLTMIVYGELSDAIRIYDMYNRKEISSIENFRCGDNLAWSPDGKWAAIGGSVVNLFSVDSKECVEVTSQGYWVTGWLSVP